MPSDGCTFVSVGLRIQHQKAQGESVIELGNGNMPISMFPYTKGDKSYLLVNNVRRELATMGVSTEHLSGDEVRELGRRVAQAVSGGT